MKICYEIKNLTFSYPKKTIFKNLSCRIFKNKITVLIGPNGVGKSTLLKIIGKIITNYKGTIFFEGENLQNIKIKKFAKKVGVMFSDINFIYNYKVLEFILMARYPYINPFIGFKKEDYEIAFNSIKLAGIQNLITKNILQLSSGELQLILIAHLLTQSTEVLLLDEPFAHLDLKHQFLVMDLLKKINKVYNKTVIIVTHNVYNISKFADEVILLKNGKILKKGKVKSTLTKTNIKNLYEIKEY